MWYVISAQDIKDSLSSRLGARPKHLARLQQLEQESRLLIAGPCPMEAPSEQFSGSVIIASFDSIEAATQWANDDPYMLEGVYQSVSVRPFKPVLGSATKAL